MQFVVGLRCLFDKVYRVTEFYNKITVEQLWVLFNPSIDTISERSCCLFQSTVKCKGYKKVTFSSSNCNLEHCITEKYVGH